MALVVLEMVLAVLLEMVLVVLGMVLVIFFPFLMAKPDRLPEINF
jgi:hypothetical protein